MNELPQSLEQAIAQARAATQAAITAGYSRLQVELLFPELKPLPVAQQYISLFADLGEHLKVFFADAGSAALARREWGDVPFTLRGVNELLEPIQAEDQAFVVVAPTPVEVGQVEKLCEQAGDRPFILLNPKLQDVSIVGIGYAGRQLRERFLNTIETCYYLRPLEAGALTRAYPAPWQVWLEKPAGEYQVIAEELSKPAGDRLDQLFAQASDSPKSRTGFLADMQRFLRALTQ
ncbi:MAG: DUF1995 family protein [Aphanocapsa sp. GSE-SYN-MK-11-07L]|jgi:hypothetical protein|nr:DUF1995 family protein [Aphanocapsa sp. GSE-SYN-MK-11-07L]